MPGKDLNPMVLLVTWSSGSTSGFFCSSMWIFALWRWCTELFSYQQIGLKAVTARMSCVSRRLFCALTMGRWMVYLCTVKYNLTPSTQHLQPVGCFNKQVNQRRLFCSKADAGWLKSRVTTRRKKKKKALEIFFKMRLLFMAFRAVRYPWFLLSSHSLDQIHSYPEQRSGSVQENGRQQAKWWAPWAFKRAQSGKDFKSNFHAKEHQ